MMQRYRDVNWDDEKSALLKRTRGLSLEEAAELFKQIHVERIKNDDPLQGLATGFAQGRLISLAYEIREQDENTVFWLITYWDATKSERRDYEREIQGQY